MRAAIGVTFTIAAVAAALAACSVGELRFDLQSTGGAAATGSGGFGGAPSTSSGSGATGDTASSSRAASSSSASSSTTSATSSSASSSAATSSSASSSAASSSSASSSAASSSSASSSAASSSSGSAGTCADMLHDGQETDVDCGGPVCPKCQQDRMCLVDSDCVSAFCKLTVHRCRLPSCGDGIKNGTETDIDCGGTCAAKCASGKGCLVGADCASAFCLANATCL